MELPDVDFVAPKIEKIWNTTPCNCGAGETTTGHFLDCAKWVAVLKAQKIINEGAL